MKPHHPLRLRWQSLPRWRRIGLVLIVIIAALEVQYRWLRWQGELACEYRDYADLSDKTIVEEDGRLWLTVDGRRLCYPALAVQSLGWDYHETRNPFRADPPPIETSLSPSGEHGMFIQYFGATCPSQEHLFVYTTEQLEPNIWGTNLGAASPGGFTWSPDESYFVVRIGHGRFYPWSPIGNVYCSYHVAALPHSLIKIVDLGSNPVRTKSFGTNLPAGLETVEWIDGSDAVPNVARLTYVRYTTEREHEICRVNLDDWTTDCDLLGKQR